MEVNSITELVDVERIARQLRLLNAIQEENMVGSWEFEPSSNHFFWSDSMFRLHGLPATPDNLITTEEAAGFIHKEDIALVEEKRKELEKSGYVDYYLRIITGDGHVRRVHAREKKVEQNGSFIMRGNWRDERIEREFQHELRELNEKQSLQLKVFERAEEVAQAGSWQINLETFETIYSDNVYRIHGLAPQSIPPHVDTFRRFIHPEDRAVVLKTQEKAYVEMIPLHLEYRIVREDGQVRYISQVSHILKNEKGEQVLSGNTRDTTDQKLLEIQLRETNDLLSLYNELFIQAEQIGKLGTWQVNLETRKSIYSDNIYRIFGLKPQSIPPTLESFLQFIHPDDQQAMVDFNNRMFDEHAPFEIEYRITRADGKPRMLRVKSKLVKNIAGESLMTGVLQDITRQKEKDLQLRETNEKLAVQNEAFRQGESIAGIGTWTWNLHTEEIFYSDNMYHIYGLKPRSIEPSYEYFSKYVHPEDRKRIKDLPEKLRRSPEPLSIEYRIINADGELRYLRARHKPITSPDGHTIIIGTTQDITDEVVMKQQLLEKIRFAEMLSDTIIDRVVVTDTFNNIIWWNKRCEHVYRKPKDTVLGRNIFDVFPQIKNAEVMDRFKRALRGETIHVPVLPSIEMPGYQELFMVPLKNEKGIVTGVLHVLHDVTEQQQLQEQLSSRLRFIEQLQEASIDRIIVLDKDMHFQVWNRQCETFYNIAAKDAIGKNILEVFPRFKSSHLYQKCLEALEGNKVYVPAIEGERPPEYYEAYFIPLKNEVEEVTGILWVTHDLTEQFLIEEQLRNSQAMLKQAQELAHIGSWEYQPKTGKLVLSDEMFRIYGYAPKSFEPDMGFILRTIHAEDRPGFENILNEIAEVPGQSDRSLITRIIAADGRILFVNTIFRSLMNKAGNNVRIIGTMQDITGQKKLEMELKSKNATIRLHDQIRRQTEQLGQTGSWQWNITTGQLVWGESMFRLFGQEMYVFEPTHENFMSLVHPDDRPLLEQQHSRILTATSTSFLPPVEFRILVGGIIKYIRSAARVFINDEARYVVGSSVDVTEDALLRQQLAEKNQALQEKNKALKELNEELTSFAFVASHDLREPLRKIQMFSDWICKKEAGNLSEDGVDRFKRIQSAVKRMDVLIDDILNFSRINTTVPFEKQLDLNGVLEKVKSDLQDTISKTKAVIETDHLPCIDANATNIYQLFQNLISNSLKYQPEGNIPVIRITCDYVDGKNIDHSFSNERASYLRIRVEDNGIGFEQQYARKIFQMFQRLHGMHQYPGTGMGLSICKKIMEKHKGFIIAEGHPGKGAAFECYFPQETAV